MAQRSAKIPAGLTPGLRVGDVLAVSLPDAPAVISQRGDGVVWRRHWSEHDRLVIEFVDLAVVEVAGSDGIVTFDRPLPDDMEEHLLFDHVLPLVMARSGAVVLHGGVISRDRSGAVLVGATGAGKSTLTAFAWQNGWTVGGDDGAVIQASDPPTVEPTYATVRLNPGSAELLGIDPSRSSPVVGKLRIAGEGKHAFSQEPVELKLIAIVEPTDAAGEATFTPMDGPDAHARLFGSTFHADLSQDRLLPNVLDDLASIVENCTVGRIMVPRGRPGLVAAEQVLRSTLEAITGYHHGRG